MIDDYVGPRRMQHLHTAVQQGAAEQDTAQNHDMQEDAAVESAAQPHKVPSSSEYTISVQDVREHLRSKGLSKSKDTVQRWCRTGELSCQKRGVLNRYFTTEASLLSLEKRLLPDMIAETIGEATSEQEDAAANAPAYTGMQVHSPEDTAAYSGKPLHEGADDEPPVDEPTNTEHTSPTAPKASGLEVENKVLREQLALQADQIEFLKEEVRSNREQRGAVVQISNRMLETLETISIGGRLERPKTSDPATYPPADGERSRV